MRKMSYDKRRAKLGKLNVLLSEYERTAQTDDDYLVPLLNVAWKIAHITGDWSYWCYCYDRGHIANALSKASNNV